MEKTLQSYADKHKNMKVDCFICCILSHGGPGVVYGCDRGDVQICDIKSKFSANKCPGLAGKPKLFFIQACRGSGADRGYKQRDDMPRGKQEICVVPNEADFLTGYATPDGYVSWRGNEGSEYIQALTNVIQEHSDMDILRILTMVNAKVGEIEIVDKKGKKYRQIPEPSNTLRKLFYFK